jgi:diguanylate cyclase
LKYDEGIERSAELLRQALPLMSRQGAGLHPISYALWYDYVAKVDPLLCAEVDRALALQGKLDEPTTQALFRRHIADIDPDTAQRISEGFGRVLTGIAASAEHAGQETQAFGNSLSRLSDALQADPAEQAGPGADAVVQALAQTQAMQATMSALQHSVDASRREIELLREEVRRARHEAQIDGLTGLANRRAFDQQMEDCIQRALTNPTLSPPCLLMGDIDLFKKVNDQYGHSIGDQVIKAVATVLKAHAPADGLAARVGGEEFALLLPGCAVVKAQTLAEAIRQRIAAARIRRHGTDEVLTRVTLSLGVTPYRVGESGRDFLERADRALYASKNAGRDRVTVLLDD